MIQTPMQPTLSENATPKTTALYLQSMKQALDYACFTVFQAWDPASVAVGGVSAAVTVTVRGAYVGMVALVAFSVALPDGCWLIANITATDTVKVCLVNLTAGAVDLGTGTLRVDVWT